MDRERGVLESSSLFGLHVGYHVLSGRNRGPLAQFGRATDS